MTIKIEIEYGITWYDISDYIGSITPVPIVSRNRDYEPTGKGFTMKVWSSCPDISKVVGMSRCRLKLDDVVKFIGQPKVTKKEFGTNYHKIEIEDGVMKLEEKFIDYDQLHSDLAGAGNDLLYRASDNESLPNLRLDWLLQVMFSQCGFSLDTTNLTGLSIATNKYVNDLVTTTQEDFNWEDIRLDENMLYAINQSYAINHTKIESNDIGSYDSQGQKITFFSFFKRICSYFSLFLKYEGSSYYLYRKNSETYIGYGVGNDNKWDYSESTEEKREPNYRVSVSASLTRSEFNNTTANSIDKVYSYGAKSGYLIPWYTNLIFLLHAKWAGADDGDVYNPVVSFIGHNFLIPLDGNIYKKYADANTENWIIRNITTSIQAGQLNILENLVDIEERESRMTEAEVIA